MPKVGKAPRAATRKTAARKKTGSRKTEPLRVRTSDSILEDLDRMRGRIMERAYELFDLRGRRNGGELEDWLDAEHELTFRPPIELSQEDGALTIEAAIPGFEPSDLEVQVTAEDILIQSDRNRPPRPAETVHQCELSHGRVFRDVCLPLRIDPTKAEAEYRSGMLRVTAPLAKPSKPQRVRIS